jgi:hypothetical protein
MLQYMYTCENDISDPIRVCRMIAIKTRHHQLVIRCWWYQRLRYWWNDMPREAVKWQFCVKKR